MLIISDNKGLPLSCSTPISGHHNDGYRLRDKVRRMFDKIENCDISIEGLVLNADAGFDVKSLRKYCHQREIMDNIVVNPRNRRKDDGLKYVYDKELGKRRFVIERTNAWLDGFKALLVRFETKAKHFLDLHYLASSIILLRQL